MIPISILQSNLKPPCPSCYQCWNRYSKITTKKLYLRTCIWV